MSRTNNQLFDLGREYKCDLENFNLCDSIWQLFECDDDWDLIRNSEPISFKFVNDDTGELHDDANLIPKTRGGIYIFLVKHPCFGKHVKYMMYIGKAEKSQSQNIHKRIHDYYAYCKDENYAMEWEDKNLRMRVLGLFRNYLKNIYIEYYPLACSNERIADIESKLICSILPPINKQIPCPEIRKATTVFGRSST